MALGFKPRSRALEPDCVYEFDMLLTEPASTGKIKTCSNQSQYLFTSTVRDKKNENLGGKVP